MRDYKDRFYDFTTNPEYFQNLCDSVCNGNSVIDFVENLCIPYNMVVNWIYDDDDRKVKYEQALTFRGEYTAQKILRELNDLSFIEASDIFNDDKSIKPMSEWPRKARASIASIDIAEAKLYKYGVEITPEIMKIKFHNKIGAIKLLGQNLKMFTDKVELVGKLTLEDLVNGSYEEDDKSAKENKEATTETSETPPTEETERI